MKGEFIIGIDIGGSHITSVAVRMNDFKILNSTKFSSKINNKADKDKILKNWAQIINSTIESLGIDESVKLAFAMPGPFDYATGNALFELNDKYESLYNVSIELELSKQIKSKKVEMRFINDATAFGIGVASTMLTKNNTKIISLTLGTGFGCAFLNNGIPQIHHKDVPENGFLWDKPFKSSIADDYFSTRWCIARYEEYTGIKIKGVKEISEAKTKYSFEVFKEFGKNMGQFLAPYLRNFEPDAIILGGNISKASEHFLPYLIDETRNEGITTHIEVSDLMEDSALLGACKLFDSSFMKCYKSSNSVKWI